MAPLLDALFRFFVYGLIDPFTGQLRYVGLSTNGLDRPKQHARPSSLARDGNKHKVNWIKSLQSKGAMYEIEILEVFESAENLEESEIWHMAYFKSIGCNLTNILPGGQLGMLGRKHTEETKKKMSAARIGKKCPWNQTPEAQERCRALHKGKVIPRETRVIMSKALGGGAIRDQHGNSYNSVAEAALLLNLNRANITSVLRGDIKTTKGYVFAYIDKDGLVKNPRSGKPLSDENRLAVSRSRGGRPIKDQYGVEYTSVSDAARKLELQTSKVSAVLKGKRAHTKGYVFSFVQSIPR